MILYATVLGLCLLFVSFATTAMQVTHLPMKRNLLNVNFSTLNASCANETQQLMNNVERLFPAVYNTTCFVSRENMEANRTLSTCRLAVESELNEAACINLGGQFYDNDTSSDIFTCTYDEDDGGSSTVFNILYYPICIGASCNASDFESALNDIKQADLEDGLLGSHVDKICNPNTNATTEPISMANETCSNTTLYATMEMADYEIWKCMERNRLKLIISNLTLSTSCASETEDLIDNMVDIFGGGGGSVFSSCSYVNETTNTCEVSAVINSNDAPCIKSGGQLYDKYTNPDFYRCIKNNNADVVITDIGLVYYPICVGASCNASEVKSALDGILLAELDNGLLGSRIEDICNSKPVSKPVSTSAVHNIFDNCGLMCFTFTLIANVIYAF